ncbi:hypothetical protein P3S67_010527 [Capsicum chacoense]
MIALKIGRDPTLSKLHLHVHTHNHDGKSFVGECSQLLHERYEEIIREKVQCKSKIDQLETYYEVVGGAKKKRLFGLGSEATSYFEKKTVCLQCFHIISTTFDFFTDNKYGGVGEAIDSGPYYSFSSDSY